MNLNLEIDGEKLKAPRKAYAKAKWKQLKEFGYSNLTPKTRRRKKRKSVEELLDVARTRAGFSRFFERDIYEAGFKSGYRAAMRRASR